MDKLQALRKTILFAQLPDEILQQLAEAATPVYYDDGKIIDIEQDSVFFVIKGLVRAYRSSLSGREQNLIHLQSGFAFNLPQVFSGQNTNPISAVAVGDTFLLRIPFDEFRDIVSNNPEAALAVLSDLSRRIIHLTQLTHDLSLRSVRSRLARFLLEQSDNKIQEHFQWTHQDIAAQVGSVREVVSRTMRIFVREGLIRITRQRVEVLDFERLQEEAEND